MKVARTIGPLSIDGVCLGQSRTEVDTLLGRAITNANPSWARYYPRSSSWPTCPGPTPPLLVSYLPAWPQDSTSAWRVESLCGSVLRQGDDTLAEVGERIEAVRARLGIPQENFSPEPGYGCLVYDGCVITYDGHGEKVVEVSLRSACRLAAVAAPAAVVAHSGALAS